jgi:hypothetical protein
MRTGSKSALFGTMAAVGLVGVLLGRRHRRRRALNCRSLRPSCAVAMRPSNRISNRPGPWRGKALLSSLLRTA